MSKFVSAAATIAMMMTSTVAFAENPHWGTPVERVTPGAADSIDMQTTGSIKPLYQSPVSSLSRIADEVKKDLADHPETDVRGRR